MLSEQAVKYRGSSHDNNEQENEWSQWIEQYSIVEAIKF